MPTHSKPDLSVTALLHNLTDELDRKKMKKMEDLMLAKMQNSVHGRLGSRINEQQVQISHRLGGSKLCGAIFMCNRRTWKECLGQSLFGLPIAKKGLVEQIIPGMMLFLFEFERRQLWGVFEAASYGAMDIIPNAYTGGSFPCQVRVKVPEECVALYEEEFCEAIRDNYYSLGKFHFDLSEKQVCRLTALFERKYLSASILPSNLLEYEDERYGCKSNGELPLLLTSDATSLYPEKLLQNSWYSSSCQVTNGPFFCTSEEDRDHSHKKGESKTRRKSSDKGSLIPLSNGALGIVKNSVSSLTGELGKGFDTLNASCLTFFGSNNHSIVEDFSTGGMSLFSDNVSHLHSDRPIAKSVWTRISGRPKSLGTLESIQAKEGLEVTPVISQPKVCTIVEMDVEDESLVQDQGLCRANVSEEAAEEFSVGFKRRRASSNNASANANETPSKQRRKLTRPSFEDAADEHVVEQGKCVPERPPLPSASGPFHFSRSSSMAGIVEDFSENVSIFTEQPTKLEEKVCWSLDVSNPGEGIVRKNASGCNQENRILQPALDVSQPNLDLNLPLEASLQNNQGLAIVLGNSPVLEDEKQCAADATARQVSGITKAKSRTMLEQQAEPPSSLVCEMQQEPCCLALSLATQETVLHFREGILPKQQPEALALVGHMEQDKMDGPQMFIGQSEQGGRADGEGVKIETGFLGKEEQGSDLQQSNISSASVSVDLAVADSLRTNTFSLAPCTPAKDFLDSSYCISEQCDERKGLSHNLAQNIPLTLELGNGAQLPDAKLRLDDIVHPEDASGNLYKREDGDNAVVHEDSADGNQSRESKTISLECTSGSNLLNQAELKSFLSGLQVSGITLQLGASPCLILKLGDSAGSTSNLDSQDQGGATPGQSEPS